MSLTSLNHPSFSTAFPFIGLLDLVPANFGQESGDTQGKSPSVQQTYING